ncbi:MAG: DUF4595 domain-containing protein [Prevotellaceae bacterium]|nr:DUF4595 domain-containing protein [Prevotellaceae bacterium]
MRKRKYIARLAAALPMALLCSCTSETLTEDMTTAAEANTESEAAVVSKSEGGTNVNVPLITTESGEKLLLASLGDYSLTYDTSGLCTTFGFGLTPWSISYDPLSVKADWGDGDVETMNATLNDAGYIATLTVSETSPDGNIAIDYSCAYDEEGHLESVTFSYSEGTYYTETGTATLTWKDGDVRKMEFKGTGTDEGYAFSEQVTMTYTYGTEPNTFQQCTMAYEDALAQVLYDSSVLSLAGLYGNGTASLPSTYDYTYIGFDEEDAYEDHFKSTVAYSKNTNGTILLEDISDWDSFAYSYTKLGNGLDTGVRSPKAVKAATRPASTGRPYTLHSRLRSRHTASGL